MEAEGMQVRSLNDILVRRFVPNYEDVENPETRLRYGLLEAIVSIVGNLFIATVNACLGIALNSIALTAQSVHTAADVITSVIVLVGFRAASMPADREHPFGHGRIEAVASLVIAVLLTIVGFEFAGESVRRFLSGAESKGSLWVAGILVAGALAKEWMARFSIDLGGRICSPALVADAWHHRSDSFAMALVAVSLVAAFLGYPRVDAVLGLAVSGLIIYTGAKLAWSSTSSLIGERANPEMEEAICKVIRSIDGVRDMHKLDVHDYGGVKVASVHIQVDRGLNVMESHKIAGAVKHELLRRLAVECVVHVEPDLKEEDSEETSDG